MKAYKVCFDCICDLQRLRHRAEGGKIKLIGGAAALGDITCQNKPRCFDQPERLNGKTPTGDAKV